MGRRSAKFMAVAFPRRHGSRGYVACGEGPAAGAMSRTLVRRGPGPHPPLGQVCMTVARLIDRGHRRCSGAGTGRVGISALAESTIDRTDQTPGTLAGSVALPDRVI